MTSVDKTEFKKWLSTRLYRYRDQFQAPASSRNQKEQNYKALKDLMRDVEGDAVGFAIDDDGCLEVIREMLKKPVEIAKSPIDLEAEKWLAELKRDASDVFIDGEVYVQLDIDQLKHQHPDTPIGQRTVSGGNLFIKDCGKTWHKEHTLIYMAKWASAIADNELADFKKVAHGQSTPVDEIHYEGFCILIRDKRYVSFHCYPANGSRLKAPFKK